MRQGTNFSNLVRFYRCEYLQILFQNVSDLVSAKGSFKMKISHLFITLSSLVGRTFGTVNITNAKVRIDGCL